MNPRKLQLGARLFSAAGVIVACCAVTAARAATPIFQEDFAYTAGTNLSGQGGWSAYAATGNNPILVGSPGLTYAGYPGSGAGNLAGPTATSGEDVAHGFTGQSSGNVYTAMLVNVASSQATGDYFFNYFDGPIGGVTRGRVFIRKSASNANYAIGIQFGSSGNPVYTGFSYAPGTTHLIVVKYSFIGGAGNDQVALFVDPAISSSEPAATLTAASGGQTDATNIDALAIRQGAGDRAPSESVDGIRVASNWSDAVAGISNVTTSVSPPGGGSITPTGPVAIPFGASQMFTITTNGCYAISGVTVDGVPKGAITSYTITNSNGSDHTISATMVASPTSTTTSLTSDFSPSFWSEAVTFTATVTPSSATGSVTFRDSLAFLGTATVSGGQAQIVRSNLRPGNHTAITATYSGDACNLGSTSAPYSQLVYRTASDCSVVSNINPKVCGELLRLSGIVTPIGVTGNCLFRSDGNFIGLANVNPTTGIATLFIGNLVSGTHNLTVEYSGDLHYEPSSSDLYPVTCSADPSSVSMTSDVTPAKFGEQVTFIATVQPDDAFGTVDFFDGANFLGTADVQGDHTASYSFTTQLAPGTHSNVHAVYNGDGCHDPSTSSDYIQVITPDLQPVVHVLFPNGNEHVCVGGDLKLTWTAVDNGSIASVMLEVSRDFGGTWETVAASVPNSGSYVWTVTGPPSAGLSCSFRATATDNAGVTGLDESDNFFQIQTCSVLVTDLETESVETGVRVKWAFSEPQAFARVVIERSTSEKGPWSAISVDLSDNAGVSEALDRSVEANHAYYYRVVGVSAAGVRVVFGPVRGTSGAPKDFALSQAWPNPSKGTLSMRISVPHEADIRLSVVDLQGREVAVLANGTHAPGQYQVSWDGRTDRGPVPAGLYFMRLRTPDKDVVNRATIAR